MKRLLPILFLLAVVTACAPDPRKDAQAYQIRTEADQNAANQDQTRQQSDDLHQLEIQRQTIDIQNKEATQATWQASIKLIEKVFGYAAAAGVFIALVALAVAFAIGSVGWSISFTHAAEIRANLIRLDPTTRQFPLLSNPQYVHNPNAGSVLMLDHPHEPDGQLIATSGVTQLAGVIGQEARRSSDPASIAVMRPPVVLTTHESNAARMIPLNTEDENE